MLIAIGNIVGSVIAIFAIFMVIEKYAEWNKKRRARLSAENLAPILGVPADKVFEDKYRAKRIEFYVQRYSADLFVNRLSDLFNVLLGWWLIFGALLSLGVGLFVLWGTIFEDPSGALLMWSVPALFLFFIISVPIADSTCRLLTGRYPGEAIEKRESVLYLLSQQAKDSTPYT